MLRQNLLLNYKEVETAHTYRQGFEKFISFAPDLVIIDVWLRLDKTDGRDLCREIRRFNKRVPIIIMSAHRDVLHDCELFGATDTIEKPFDINGLLTKINRLI
jgi:DNA-binding response OmpR family regulator